MQKVSGTRMELLAHKAQLVLARQGHDLLEQKRTVLMQALMHLVAEAMRGSDTLQKAAAEARMALARAEATAGAETVESVALSTRGEFSLQVKTATVAGIRVPHIERKQGARAAFGRGYSVTGTSLTIDEAATAFEAEIDTIIRLAESELCLVRLADEVQRTSRRLNALDSLLIPRLEAERDHIQMALDERERSDHARLKLVKRLLERKRTGEAKR